MMRVLGWSGVSRRPEALAPCGGRRIVIIAQRIAMSLYLHGFSEVISFWKAEEIHFESCFDAIRRSVHLRDEIYR
jgi:hypothetical protein